MTSSDPVPARASGPAASPSSGLAPAAPPPGPAPAPPPRPAGAVATPELGGPKGLEPTRYGDWERDGRCVDF